MVTYRTLSRLSKRSTGVEVIAPGINQFNVGLEFKVSMHGCLDIHLVDCFVVGDSTETAS